jgi:hypothetical protein
MAKRAASSKSPEDDAEVYNPVPFPAGSFDHDELADAVKAVAKAPEDKRSEVRDTAFAEINQTAIADPAFVAATEHPDPDAEPQPAAEKPAPKTSDAKTGDA